MGYKRKRTSTRRMRPRKTRRFQAQKRRKGRSTLYNQRYGGVLGIETKWYDMSGSDALIGSTAASCAFPQTGTTCLNSISQGDGGSQRDGNKCFIKSISWRIRIKDATTSLTSDPIFRLILLNDKQNNAESYLNSLSITDIFTDDPTNKTDIAFRKISTVPRYDVLYDKTFTMKQMAVYNGAAVVNAPISTKLIKGSKKVGIPVSFKATTAAQSSIIDNAIRIYLFCSEGNFHGDFHYRVRFVG